MAMELSLVAASTQLPITLGDAKQHLYVTDNTHDADIEGKMRAATEFCQRRISGHRQFLSATYDGIMPQFPHDNIDDRITFPLPPLQSITSIKYFDGSGDLISSTGGTTSWTSTSWLALTPTESPGFAVPLFGKTWPETRQRPDAVTVRFVAGSSAPADVPETIKQAVRFVLGHWFVNRESVVVGTISSEVGQTVDALLGANEYGHYG